MIARGFTIFRDDSSSRAILTTC